MWNDYGKLSVKIILYLNGGCFLLSRGQTLVLLASCQQTSEQSLTHYLSWILHQFSTNLPPPPNPHPPAWISHFEHGHFPNCSLILKTKSRIGEQHNGEDWLLVEDKPVVFERLITPALTSSFIVCGCNSVKSGGPTFIFQHYPQQFHGGNRTEVWCDQGMRNNQVKFKPLGI